MNEFFAFDGADFGEYLLAANVVASGKEASHVQWARKFME